MLTTVSSAQIPIPTLVLSPRVTDDSEAMALAAAEEGWDVERLPSWRVPEHLRDRDVTLYGEVLFVEVVAARLSLTLLETPATWLTALPERYLLRRVRASTLGDARQTLTPTFIKPADGKSFPAGAYDTGAALPDQDRLAADTLVLISDPATWDVEYRCFLRGGEVAAITPYIRAGQLAEAPDGTWPALPGEVEDALAFARRLLSDPAVPAPPAAVIDVGLITGAGWAVVESNPVWSSGICGADPKHVLGVIQRAVLHPHQITELDRPWIRTPVEFE